MTAFADFIAELSKDLESLCGAVYRLAHVDDVFWQVQAILKANKDFEPDGAVFQNWMASCYADSIAVGLRRLVDADKRTRSLFRILEKMKPHAHEFSRSWYVGRHTDELQRMAHAGFSDLVGGEIDALTEDIIARQQETLKASLKVVSDYTDQFVAHSDMKPVARVPTFVEVREAIVDAFDVIRWLGLLIDSSAILSPVPVIQTNWLRNFQVPWLTPEQKIPAYDHLDDLVKQRRKKQEVAV
jgi:hypothetical protein